MNRRPPVAGPDREAELAEALDRSLAGPTPPVSSELAPLIGLASAVRSIPRPDIDQDHFFSTLLRLGITLDRRQRPPLFQRAWARAAAGIVLFLALGVGASLFSQKSGPDGFLYPVKLLTEQVRVAFTSDQTGKVELRLVFAETRSREFARKLEKTNTVDRRLLRAMLVQAAQALDQTAALPGSRRQPLLDRAQSLNRYQYGILDRAKTRAPADSLVLDQALCTCRERMEYFHGLSCANGPAGLTSYPGCP